MTILQPVLRAFAQLDDRVLLRVVLASLAWALAGFVALAAGLAWAGHAAWQAWGPQHGVWAGLAAWLAGPLGAVVAGSLLFLPVAALVASLYAERVADAVERRWYPALPPAAPAPLMASAWDALVLGLKVLGAQIVAFLLALFVPGLGLVLGWAVTAWALGRGLFVALALRRMGRAEARALCRRRFWPVLAQGALMAALGVVPLLALLAPVLGTAALVHVLDASDSR